MSRQVALGGVIGFLATVIAMATCQKNEPAPQPGGGPTLVQTLEPVQLGDAPRMLPVDPSLRRPSGPRPMLLKPMNTQVLELLDAGHR